MFVMPTNSSPIMGLETSQHLNLIKQVESLKHFNSDIFGEIGCLPGKHHIQINKNAVPVVHPLRHSLHETS